jgi:cytochrome o ubiquinol oxidase subunit 2
MGNAKCGKSIAGLVMACCPLHGSCNWIRLNQLLRAGKLLTLNCLLLFCSGCTSLSRGFLLSPAGPIAQMEHHEFMIVGIVLLFVLAPVLLLVPLIAWHYRISNTEAAFRPQWGFSWILEVLIWVPPTGIVVLLSVFLVRYTTQLDPYRTLPTGGAATLQVDVVALDWKWLFLYPAQHVATVNELILPIGQPVHFSMTSGTVMQSLLMPQLAGQIFAMDGMTTQLNFEISKPGTYLGENTQYNGDGFRQDKFTVEAVPPGQFEKWTAQARANPATLDDPAYQMLSRQSVLATPMSFGHFEPGLFKRIVNQQIPPGYLAQHNEGGND